MAVQHLPQWEQFDRLVRKIMSYYEAIGLLHWDLRTGAPRKEPKSVRKRSGFYPQRRLNCKYRKRWDSCYHFCGAETGALDDRKRRMIAEVRKVYDQSKSIPPERFQEYSILAAQSETKWEEAKKNSDFEGFEPYLTKIVAFKQEFIEYWGVKTPDTIHSLICMSRI